MAEQPEGTYEFNVTQTTKVNGVPMRPVNLTFKAQGMKQETFVVKPGKDPLTFCLPKVRLVDLDFLMIIPVPDKPLTLPDSVTYSFQDKPAGKDGKADGPYKGGPADGAQGKRPWIPLQGAHTFYNGAQRLIGVENIECISFRSTEQPVTITIVMGYEVPPEKPPEKAPEKPPEQKPSSAAE